MTLLYVGAGLFVIARNVAVAAAVLARIAVLAFDPAATRGRLLGLILISVQRGAFSNEAGLAPKPPPTAPNQHAVWKGLVAMLWPEVNDRKSLASDRLYAMKTIKRYGEVQVEIGRRVLRFSPSGKNLFSTSEQGNAA